jgi:HK97 family phage portal protein
MGFWRNLIGADLTAITPNDNDPAPPPGSVGAGGSVNPGDPEGVEFDGEQTFHRSLPFPAPSPWSGYPANWSTPNWAVTSPISGLIDIAWACADLNSSILASMPVYRLKDGRIIEPTTWMTNPDPMIYTCWQEFAKQVFWDYLVVGEAFVLPMAKYADDYPLYFRVIPPWLVNVEMRGGRREYNLGSRDVTDEILHIRYMSSTADAHGHGPLEVVGARITSIGLLQKYTQTIAETGGVPMYWLELDRKLSREEANELLNQWVESRARRAGEPALTSNGAKLNQAHSMNAHDMMLLELSQFNESRIATLMGTPPFLVGLAGAGGLVYSNVTALFDFHDRSSLRPKANFVMNSLSNWALPRGQSAELNRDDYTRPDVVERATANKIYLEAGVLSVPEVRIQERFLGEQAPIAMTGGAD